MKQNYSLGKFAGKMLGCILLLILFFSNTYAQTMSRQNKLIIEKGIQYQSWIRVDHPEEYPPVPPNPSKSTVGRTGRFIRVQLGTTDVLSLAEVQVFSGGVNVALGKTTIQSSTNGTAISNLAVDGNTNGVYSSGSVTHTIADRSQIEPWWQVDLGSVVTIDSIRLWNRTDCCGERLKGYYLFVSDNAYGGNTLNSTLAQAGVTRFVGDIGVDYYPIGADLTNSNMSPVYYENPRYNYNVAQQHPDLQWGLALFTAVEPVRTPSTFEKTTDFLNSLQKTNLSKLTTVCFGDEKVYSTTLQADLTQWYAASKALYPNVLVHNNQYFGQWNESTLRTYTRAAKPDLLTYDWYYFYSHVSPTAGTSYGNMLRDMMMYRRVALEGYDGTGTQPIIYGGYLQAYNGFGYKRNNTTNPGGMTYTYVPSESEYNIGAYSFMLMGAKWLSVWRLLGKGYGPYAWQDDAGGWLPTYYTYSRIGKEVKNLSPHLSRLQSKDIRFIPGQNQVSGTVATNAMPSGISAWAADADPYIKSITATNLVLTTNNGLRGDVAVGYFTPVVGIDNTAGIAMTPIEHKDAKYFMLMNGLVKSNTDTGNPVQDTIVGKAALCKQKIALSIDFGTGSIDTLYRVNRSTGVVEQMNLTMVSGTQYALVDTLDGGMADLFYWKNAGKPSTGPANGTALRLNNGTISAGDVSTLSGASKFTIEGWVKFNTLSAWSTIFYRYASGTNRIVLSSNNVNGLHVVVTNGSTNFANSADNIVAAGQWYHLAMVYDGTQANDAGKLKLYVNGLLQTLTFGGGVGGAVPATTGTTTSPLTVGASSAGGTNLFDGTVDEIRIWNTALSSTDINNWKNKTLGSCHTNIANLQVYWPLNNSSNPAVATPGLTTSNTGTITTGSYVSGGWASASSACSIGQNSLHFSGGSVNGGNVTSLNSTNKFTIESWVKFDNVGLSRTVMSKLNNTNNRIVLQTETDNSLYVVVANGSNAYGRTPINSIAANQWYHFAMVYDGTQSTNAARLKFYINGNPITLTYTGTIPATTATNTNGLLFGGYNELVGNIDEVRIWNNNLSAATLLAWKDKALGSCHPNSANLQLYWQFNDSSNPAVAVPGLSTTYTGNITNGTYLSPGQASGSSGCAEGLMSANTLNKLQVNFETEPTDKQSSVYPNPVQGVLNVELYKNDDSQTTINVFNTMGQVVFQAKKQLSKGANQFQIDFTNQTPGLYVLRVKDAQGEKQFKVIKK